MRKLLLRTSSAAIAIAAVAVAVCAMADWNPYVNVLAIYAAALLTLAASAKIGDSLR